MRKKLRMGVMDVDLVCSQPSCPICSEDFEVDARQMCLPCQHYFHEQCVVPWLDAKKTCPICRFKLTNEIPSTQELEKFPLEELLQRCEAEQQELKADQVKRSGDEQDSDRSKEKTAPVSPNDLPPSKAAVAQRLHALMSQRAEESKRAAAEQAQKQAALAIGGSSELTRGQVAPGGLGEGLRRRLADSSDEEDGGRPFGTFTSPARSTLTQSFLRDIFGDSSASAYASASDRDGQLSSVEVQEMLGPGRMRLPAERISAPSFSNRTLREVINAAEAEDAARQRIAAQVASQNALFGEDIIPLRGREPSGAELMAALLSNQSNRFLGNHHGLAMLGDSDDEAAEGDDQGGIEEDINTRISGTSRINVPTHFGMATTNPRLMPMSAYLHSPIGTPTGRTMTLANSGIRGMPQTFVIRSSGAGEVAQIERRAALHQSMREMEMENDR